MCAICITRCPPVVPATRTPRESLIVLSYRRSIRQVTVTPTWHDVRYSLNIVTDTWCKLRILRAIPSTFRMARRDFAQQKRSPSFRTDLRLNGVRKITNFCTLIFGDFRISCKREINRLSDKVSYKNYIETCLTRAKRTFLGKERCRYLR